MREAMGMTPFESVKVSRGVIENFNQNELNSAIQRFRAGDFGSYNSNKALKKLRKEKNFFGLYEYGISYRRKLFLWAFPLSRGTLFAFTVLEAGKMKLCEDMIVQIGPVSDDFDTHPIGDKMLEILGFTDFEIGID